MTYGVGFFLPNHPARWPAWRMNDDAVKAIILTAVGSALGAVLYHFFVYPLAAKHLSNNG